MSDKAVIGLVFEYDHGTQAFEVDLAERLILFCLRKIDASRSTSAV